MCDITEKLVVYFEEPFWVGVFERIENEKLSVTKITFGAEPKDYEVYEFVLAHYNELKFSPSIKTDIKQKPKNPKRMLKAAKKQLQEAGIGTKSQQALKLQQEQNKVERKKFNREQYELEQQRLFNLKQQKKKEKHKGH